MRSLAVRAASFLALGAVTTLIVAWWLAASSPFAQMPRFNTGTGLGKTSYRDVDRNVEWTYGTFAQPGLMKIIAVGGSADDPNKTQGEAAQFQSRQSDVAGWSVMRRLAATHVANRMYYEQAFGWPWLAMRMCHHRPQGATWNAAQTDALSLPASFRSWAPGGWLPLRMIPAGAIADTLLFAWLWFAVLVSPALARARVRRWRGACASCGYDLRCTPSGRCPECGVNVGSTHTS